MLFSIRSAVLVGSESTPLSQFQIEGLNKVTFKSSETVIVQVSRQFEITKFIMGLLLK